MNIELKAGVKIALATFVLMGFASCAKTPEELMVGEWNTTHVTQRESSPDEEKEYDLIGYENYHITFARDGLCRIVDRGVQYVYEWYMVGDSRFILVDYLKVTQEFSIRQLDRKKLVYTYSFDYPRPSDSVTVSVLQTFELERE